MTSDQRKLLWEWFTNPPPGSKTAEARDWGIDLSLLYENLLLSPTERARKLEQGANSLLILRMAGDRHAAKQ